MDQNQNSLIGPLAIFWDIENCSVPRDTQANSVPYKVRDALQASGINRPIKLFCAYGDFSSFTVSLKKDWHKAGVELIDVSSEQNKVANKAILVAMFEFALDNDPPASIMLISGDTEFSSALHVLGQRGYTIILAFPFKGNVSSALHRAGTFVWDWQSLAYGEGVKMMENKDKGEEGQATNIDDLKCEFVKMISGMGGALPLGKLDKEYKRVYGRVLYPMEYGAIDVAGLLTKMTDSLLVEKTGKTNTIRILHDEDN